MNTHFYLALIIGLSSSFHCVGMCGPIVAAIPLNRKNNFTIASGLIQYNLGRVFTYAVLGFLIGNIGLTIDTFHILQIISVVLGVIMLIYAWKKYINIHFNVPMLSKFQLKLGQLLGKALKSKSPFKYVSLGLLNGLLPCGMVFIALSNALLTGNPLDSSIAMLFFGLGTMPMLISVGFIVNRITPTFRQRMSKLVPYMLSIVAILVILRGLNLDIPYVSPKVSLTEEVTKEEPAEVVMECCKHKKECD